MQSTKKQHDAEQWYLQGKAYDKNYENVKSAECYAKAAEQGYAPAQLELGIAYEFGYGVEKNQKLATEWYQKAALQGEPMAQISMGRCCFDGNGVPKAPETAVRWYIQAAEQGHAEAQRILGYCIENGLGTEKNEQAAVEWYLRAALQGDSVARLNLKEFCEDKSHNPAVLAWLAAHGITENIEE